MLILLCSFFLIEKHVIRIRNLSFTTCTFSSDKYIVYYKMFKIFLILKMYMHSLDVNETGKYLSKK